MAGSRRSNLTNSDGQVKSEYVVPEELSRSAHQLMSEARKVIQFIQLKDHPQNNDALINDIKEKMIEVKRGYIDFHHAQSGEKNIVAILQANLHALEKKLTEAWFHFLPEIHAEDKSVLATKIRFYHNRLSEERTTIRKDLKRSDLRDDLDHQLSLGSLLDELFLERLLALEQSALKTKSNQAAQQATTFFSAVIEEATASFKMKMRPGPRSCCCLFSCFSSGDDANKEMEPLLRPTSPLN